MGATISSSIMMGITYCCCTATGSLCNACLGSTRPTSTGRKRSVLLLTIAIALSFYFQYIIGPTIVSKKGQLWEKGLRWIPQIGGDNLHQAWYNPCRRYDPNYVPGDDDPDDEDKRWFNRRGKKRGNNKNNSGDDLRMLNQCAGMSGVYRPMFITTFFFIGQAIATYVNPEFNRLVWPAKLGIFLLIVFCTVFMSSSPIFVVWYLWLARIGASLFLLLQQVILVDVAYNWNDEWVERADYADRYVEYGAGSTWLQAIVATCIAFYSITLIAIGMLYHYFDSCAGNTWIITLTLLGIVAMTAVQLTGQEGSLLTSSVICLYVTYLAYSMVSKNPVEHCNPQLGGNDVWGIIVGLSLTAISLAWTGWSWTANNRLNVNGMQTAHTVTATGGGNAALTVSGHGVDNGNNVNLDVPFLDPNEQPASGMVLEGGGSGGSSSGGGDVSSVAAAADTEIWKLNVVLALISCWVAMILTGWGAGGLIVPTSSSSEGNGGDGSSDGGDMYAAANPTVGRMNMAMIGISQWLTMALYVWTLVAPRIFPDRDFS